MVQGIDYMKSASEVRKEWSSTIDTALREHPVFIQRTRDKLILLDIATLRLAFENLRFELILYPEKDGSVTLVESHLDLVEKAANKDSGIDQMIHALRDYACDFYSEFALWSKAPNRKSHIPYILKVLSSTDDELREDIVCRSSESN